MGYKPERQSIGEILPLWKSVDTGVRFGIQYELLPHFIDPIRSFQISLIRLVQQDDSYRVNSEYTPLAIDLYNFMWGVHKREIFPPGIYEWEFSDQASLLALLEQAQSWLVEYGIPWLEDPLSNMEWVHRQSPSNRIG